MNVITVELKQIYSTGIALSNGRKIHRLHFAGGQILTAKCIIREECPYYKTAKNCGMEISPEK
jgi:hypothetical protein